MKRILFIASHRKERAPNQRYRFEQFFDVLEKAGYECEISSLLNEQDDKTLYSKNHLFGKFKILIKSHRKRKQDIKRAKEFDAIFICREAIMTRTTKYEKAFKLSGVPVVYDFDDAIWLSSTSKANKNLQWLKNPSKTAAIIQMASCVLAGNQYLVEFAKKYNSNVQYLPTTVDTDEYINTIPDYERSPITIGWSGSLTTVPYFEMAIPILKLLKEKYTDKIRFLLIGDPTYYNSELDIKGIAWNKDSEIEDLKKIDIGIMPLPDDEWSKGKCGLKGIVYMSMSIPAVMSAVGANNDIIEDGINGFLAKNDNEWITKLSALIEDKSLRLKIGMAGRENACKRYSKSAWKDSFKDIFDQLTTK